MNSSYLEPEPRSRKATEDLPEPPDDQEYTKQNSHRPSSRKPPRRLDADLLTRQDIEALIRSRDGGGKYCTGYALSEDGVWRPHSWVMDATGAVVETTQPRVAYFGYEFTDGEIEAYQALVTAS